MSRPPISVTIITLNEELNLPGAIRSVAWADEVLVVDSGSSDRTVELARELGARVLSHGWEGYGQQKNFAQTNAKHDWILNLDADERVPAELARELQDAVASAEARGIRGFRVARKTYYLGRWIRYGGWFPNYLARACDRRHARWTEPRVHEELRLSGPAGTLASPLDHFAFPSIREQVLTNLRYAREGAEQQKNRGLRPSRFKLVFKPIGKFLETYVLKRGFLDGLPGFIICVNAAYSMFMKQAFQLEDGIRRAAGGAGTGPRMENTP
jgi:glycosyltransferase involved in cell wall biosynthesis